MRLTEQQFLDSLNADQTAFYNSRLLSIRDQFQATYAVSVSEVTAAKAQQLNELQTQVTTLTAEKAALQADAERLIGEKASLLSEVERLTPPPVPDGFLTADWARFRNLILSDEAVQRVAFGNPTAWPLIVLYLTQLSSTPSRGADIAALWTIVEQNTPVTPDEVARINAIASECGVPLRMHENGSIG